MRADLAAENCVLGDHDLSEIRSGKVSFILWCYQPACSVMKLERLLVRRQLQAAAVQREHPGCVSKVLPAPSA